MRILRNTAATLSVTFAVDGVGTDPSPDSATVTVTREDGTAVVTDAATTPGPAGLFTYNLVATHSANLDLLTARWTATLQGQVQTLESYVEVVGGFVCSLAEIDRVLNRGGDASSYSVEDKQWARDVATDAFEAEVGQAFTPRYKRLTFDGSGSYDLVGPWPLLAVSSGTVDDTALTADELADINIGSDGVLYRDTRWGTGRQSIALKVEHGHRYPPAYVSRAVALIAASVLKDGPYDDRGYGVTDDGQSVRLLTAGVQGAAFSIPDVQAAVRRCRVPVIG